MCDLEMFGILAEPEDKAVLDRFCQGGCHVASIKLEIKSLDALRQACQRLGFQWMEGQRTYRWFGRWVGDSPLPEGVSVEDLGKCDHAIQVPGASYEVGVVYKNGTWRLLWDFWSTGGLAPFLGKEGERLKQAYGIEVAKMQAQRSGYSVWEEQQQDGGVRLHIQV